MAGKKNRKFTKGASPYRGWVAPVIIIAFLLFMIYTGVNGGYYDLNFYGVKYVGYIILFLVVCAVVYVVFKSVWVSEKSTVYHNRPGCAGANKKANRMLAKIKGLQPCSKCHKISGMNRH